MSFDYIPKTEQVKQNTGTTTPQTTTTSAAASSSAQKTNSVFTEKSTPASTKEANTNKTEQQTEIKSSPKTVSTQDDASTNVTLNDKNSSTSAPTQRSAEEKDIEDYILKHKDNFPKDATVDDIYAYLIKKTDKTEEEKKILENFKNRSKQEKETTAPKEEEITKISEKAAKNAEKCKKIIDGNGTNYEKLSQIMDIYLSENDPEYQKLPDYQGTSYKKDKKRNYRDKLISDLRKDFAPGNLSTAERVIMHQQLTALFTNCIAQDKTIESITAKGKGAIKEEIENIQDREFAQVMNIETENLSNKEIIREFADKIFSKDDEYNKLPPEKKDVYIQNKTRELLKKSLGIDISKINLTPEKNEVIEKTIVAAIKAIKEKKYTISDLQNEAKQNEVIARVFENNPTLESEIKEKTPKMYDGIMMFKEKNNLINTLKSRQSKGYVTEGEIYQELKRLEKNNSLNNEQKILLRFYEGARDMDAKVPNYSKKLFSQNASNSSLIAKAALVGMDVPEYVRGSLQNKDGQYLKGTDLENALKVLLKDANGDMDAATIYAIYIEMTNAVGSPKEAMDIMRKHGAKFVLAGISAKARNDGSGASIIDNLVAQHGTEEEIKLCKQGAIVSSKYLDVEQQGIYWEGQKTDLYDKEIATSIDTYKSKEEAVQIHKYIANSQIVTDERKISVTKSIVETAAPERQLYYASEMSKIKNAAVTEGLAAAEQNVDSSVRQQYSRYVDNAVQNNGYTQEQKANIEQARQTGQVSYERSSSSEGASDKSSSTGTRTSSNTPSASRTSSGYTTTTTASYSSSTGGSGSSSGTASTSGSKPTYVAFGSTNYGDQVTKALADKKTRTQERITQIIDNYQKTTKAQEAKAEKQADTTSKEATSQAAKAAEKEAKVVKTFVESPQASGNIDAKTIQELKTAYSSGGMKGLYEKLGTLGETVQEKFLSFFAKYSDGNSLHSFASSFSNNKNIIISLYQYSNDPSLLAYLGESATMDLLSKGKIKMKDFLKYASPSTIALYISDLNKTGNHELLKQIFGLLNLSQASYVQQHTSKPTLGGDDWMEQLQSNMSRASGFEMSDGLAMGSDRAPMGRSYDKMKQRGPFYFNA